MDLKEPVTTQEQLDKIVKDRLEREREKVRSEFSDYDDLKAKAEKLDELEKSGSEELKKALAEVDNLKGELQTRDENAKLQQMRKQVAKDTGVPPKSLLLQSFQNQAFLHRLERLQHKNLVNSWPKHSTN